MTFLRTIVWLFIFSSTLQTTFARCGMRAMSFHPKETEISLNPMFIITGYAMSQKTVMSFENRKVFLESEHGQVIELELQELLVGQKRITQAIFKPIGLLKSNTTYYLGYIDETEEDKRGLIRWNQEIKASERISWKTSDMVVVEPLSSNLIVEFEKTKIAMYGCGPEVNAVFNVEKSADTETWYRTELVNLSTGKKRIFYLMDWNQKLNVGHDMCSGPFVFDAATTYKVRFTPMNVDGVALETSNWTTFDSPLNKYE